MFDQVGPDGQALPCDECTRRQGLCRRCAERDRSILPLLAEPRLWHQLLGVALIEQRRLQMAENRPSPAALKVMRRKARKAELRTLARAISS